MHFQRLVDTLKQDDVEVRRRLSEMTRRMTVLRVNEKALVRRHNTLEEIEDTMRKVSFTVTSSLFIWNQCRQHPVNLIFRMMSLQLYIIGNIENWYNIFFPFARLLMHVNSSVIPRLLMHINSSVIPLLSSFLSLFPVKICHLTKA